MRGLGEGRGRGGGHLGTEWITTAKGLHGAEAVNAKTWRESAPFEAKKGVGQCQIYWN